MNLTVGIDAEQIRALYDLHAAWAAEQGSEIDSDAWVENVRGAAGSGRFLPWVAWDGERPVGCAELHLIYDPISRKTAACGERGFVLPEYRSRGVFESITESMLAYAETLGVHAERMSADTDWMRDFYGRYGFAPVSTCMGRTL